MIEIPLGYSISPLPAGSVNRAVWSVKVEYRQTRDDGVHLYAVTHLGACLRRNGKWAYEPLPSERQEEFLAETRFEVEQALELARGAVEKLVVNGKTAAQVLAWEQGF